MSALPIDLEPLLRPLEDGANGVGNDLRLDVSTDPPYRQLKDARRTARDLERERDRNTDDSSDSPTAPPDGWRVVLTLGQQILTEQSKDLEVAAWLTEALVRLHGMAGLQAGAELIAGLCDRFWVHCHPLPDEDGLKMRALPLGGLSGERADGTVLQPLRQLTVCSRPDGTALTYFLWDKVERSGALGTEKREELHAAGLPRMDALVAEAQADRKFVKRAWTQAYAAQTAWATLETVLNARFAAESPSTRNVKELLEKVIAMLAQLGGAAVDSPAAPPEPQPEPPQTLGVSGGDPAKAAWSAPAPLQPGTLARTRESALRELEAVAEFFRVTEPHSPLAYTLEEAVRRGRMTLAELLAEVLPETDARSAMLGRLGMRVEPK